MPIRRSPLLAGALLAVSLAACGASGQVPTTGATSPPAATGTTAVPAATTTSTVPAATAAPGPFTPVVEGLPAPPLDLVEVDSWLLVGDQTGTVWAVDPAGTGVPTVALDLSERIVELRPEYDERGLLGMTLDGDTLYVSYTAPLAAGGPAGWDHTNVVSAFPVESGEGSQPVIDPAAEAVVLTVDQPYYSHSGGALEIGPDGHLYVGLGDGGPGGDPNHHAQAGDSLLGKVLRVDPDPSGGYAVPSDNPFVDVAGVRPEVFASGFRQPYRMSFSPGGELLVGDVGHDRWEEVNAVVAGGNYGWNVREGFECFQPADPAELYSECTEEDLFLDPRLAYDQSVGNAVVGGHVIDGRYVFADWTGGMLTADLDAAEPVPEPLAGLPGGLNVVGLAVDGSGRLHVLTSTGLGPVGSEGAVFRYDG